MSNVREQWSSKASFILAAAGSAVGLGNIWKFPYIAGENGGAAFLFIYMICIVMIGLPILNIEILLGRATQKNPVGAFKALSGKPFWTYVGALGVLASFTILSFYSVAAGWALSYVFNGFQDITPESSTSSFKRSAPIGQIFLPEEKWTNGGRANNCATPVSSIS